MSRARRRRWVRITVLVGCLALVAALAAPIGVGHLRGTLTIAAASGGGSGSRTALLAGTLGGERTSETTACFWVETEVGRVYVRWPHGWTAKVDPLKVVDAWGLNGVRIGDPIELGGGSPSDDDLTLPGCDLPADALVFLAGTAGPPAAPSA